jgi:hypothetical protein
MITLVNGGKMDANKQKVYTIYDVLRFGYTVEPLVCIHCQEVGEVTVNHQMGDGHCGLCGKWQLDKGEEFVNDWEL